MFTPQTLRPLILVLDSAGSPTRWATATEAVLHYAKSQVAHEVGDSACVVRGGVNARTGLRSSISTNSIIMVKGHAHGYKRAAIAPPISRGMLFARDRFVCAYCGGAFDPTSLSMDHIQPASRGGADTWLNLVSACRTCNAIKADRTPQEARMSLLYVPYVPNHAEALILANRRILADQMAFLLQAVPRASRLQTH